MAPTDVANRQNSTDYRWFVTHLCDAKATKVDKDNNKKTIRETTLLPLQS